MNFTSYLNRFQVQENTWLNNLKDLNGNNQNDKYYHSYPPSYRDLIDTRNFFNYLNLRYFFIFALPVDLLPDGVPESPFNSCVLLYQSQADCRVFPPGYCNCKRSLSPGCIGNERTRRLRTGNDNGVDKDLPWKMDQNGCITEDYCIPYFYYTQCVTGWRKSLQAPLLCDAG